MASSHPCECPCFAHPVVYCLVVILESGWHWHHHTCCIQSHARCTRVMPQPTQHPSVKMPKGTQQALTLARKIVCDIIAHIDSPGVAVASICPLPPPPFVPSAVAWSVLLCAGTIVCSIDDRSSSVATHDVVSCRPICVLYSSYTLHVCSRV